MTTQAIKEIQDYINALPQDELKIKLASSLVTLNEAREFLEDSMNDEQTLEHMLDGHDEDSCVLCMVRKACDISNDKE